MTGAPYIELENFIREQIAIALKQRKVGFWGRECSIKPELIDEVFGDGMKLMRIWPINHRPNYWIVRVDSQIDLDSDEWLDVLEEQIYVAIDEQFGPAEWTDDRGRTRRERFPSYDGDGCVWEDYYQPPNLVPVIRLE